MEPVKHLIRTADDWQIAVFEYGKATATRNYPVFLVHGIASDHHIWDLREGGNNFARFLTEKGFRVFSIDLRGRGASDGPHTGRGNNWSVDDYLLCDLPAAVDFVLETCGTERLHWMGHSMGGFLAYFYQIRHSHIKLQSHTTFASALSYTFSTINMFRAYMDWFTWMPYFPVGMMWRMGLPFSHMDLPWNRFLWNPENMDPEDCRAITTNTLGRIGILEWNQIKTISTAEGMFKIAGSQQNLTIHDPRIRVPVLILAGDKDAICPLDGVIWTQRKLKAKSKLKVFGTDYGNELHYGHIDLVVGKHAPHDVWPHALENLLDRDDLEEAKTG